MENNTCLKHGKKQLVLFSSEKYDLEDTNNKYICRVCMFNSKEEIDFFYSNFDNFKNLNDISNKKIEEKLKEYEGFHILNKEIVNFANEFKLENDFYNKFNTNKEKLRNNFKDGLKTIYDKVTDNFEKTVDELDKKVDSLDFTLKTAKEEIGKIEEKLGDQIKILESEKKLCEEYFEKLEKKLNSRFRYTSKEKLIDPELKISFKRGAGNTNFTNGSNVVIAERRNTGSYWRVCSEEVLEGPFFAKLRINTISRTSDWSLNIGIQRSNSVNDSSYYNDGMFFMCSGKKTVQFQGSQSTTLFRTWVNGDEIIISRDEKNDIYFGLNDEADLKLAYNAIVGSYRICVGFSTACTGDNIEFLELEN